MNRSRVALLRASLMLSDAAVIVMAFALASRLRFGPTWLATWQALVPELEAVLAVAVAVALLGLWRQGLYGLVVRWSLRTELGGLLRTGAALMLLTLAALFAAQLGDVSRLFLSVFFPLVAAGLVGARVLIRGAFKLANARGRGLRHVLLVGSGPVAQRYLLQGGASAAVGVRVIGYVGDAADGTGPERLGAIADLPRILATSVVDEVVIALPLIAAQEVEFALAAAEEQGKAVRIPLHLRDDHVQGARLEVVGATPTLAVRNSADDSVAKLGKRVLDVAVASVALVLATPVLLTAMLAIALTDGFPVVFRQRRTGLHGRDFHALKLRTMVRDAEARLADLSELNERSGPVFKMVDDPRITRVGRFLRRTSIDELPQLVNVLRGEMSLVGPRPATLDEVERYAPWHRRRLSVKPGMTGLWQVSARNDPDFDNWVALDLAYIDGWSLQDDVKLLARTPVALLRNAGT
jgi:exopolysaccharide biosynthesis polyprenyl glycosylphosphotransferase